MRAGSAQPDAIPIQIDSCTEESSSANLITRRHLKHSVLMVSGMGHEYGHRRARPA
jgi:hypothetical protein